MADGGAVRSFSMATSAKLIGGQISLGAGSGKVGVWSDEQIPPRTVLVNVASLISYGQQVNPLVVRVRL